MGDEPVSYTHLDVYKRQVITRAVVRGGSREQRPGFHNQENDKMNIYF